MECVEHVYLAPMYIQLQLPVNMQVSFCLGSTCSGLFGITSASWLHF
jgi:hypothetical protein